MRFLVDNNLSPLNLPMVADDLVAGAVVVLGDEWVRIRRLPLLPPP